ncbi:Cj0069 family protein [Winogradskyella sp.]|jgi:glutathione synthase/RimK-type ligase-like ATP-grasp enzyme|uniref:Cj0069 family protein n=1 Tax=Winogradskyella sp. TaxID=1883156 RepID=UPI0025EF9986|nr:Cj0069 family protein [Winogradskyella sp.]MCT4630477.1 Cj0069 family protein [Winogradskyella sp.]
MKKHVVIFEARGGSDKGKYGFRKDSKPIIDSLKDRGWSAEIIFYKDEDRGEIYRHTIEKADAYISRVNPGNLVSETGYFQMLRELVNNGVEGLPHPDAMIAYGAKNSVEKLKGSDIVPDDVYTYYDFDTLKEAFPKSLKNGVRVIKQNRGSTGEGIWRVEVLNADKYKSKIPLDAKLKLTEARDNHTEEKTLQEFLEYCIKYLEGDNGMLLDMPFLERIKEGEIRVLMLREKVVNIVHKKPAEGKDAFSATLFSGAKYRYDKPDQWPELVNAVEKSLPTIQKRLGNYDLPLIWTADFILDTDKKTGKDKYVLGEINASCVGFTTFLELSENIADEVLELLDAEEAVNRRWAAFSK